MTSRWPSGPPLGVRLLVPLVALVLLNAALTFENVWPTPGVRWGRSLSIELAALLLALGAVGARRRSLSRRALGALSGLWLLLAVGRYGDVTAPALYGRDVNLYWDLPHVWNVASMLALAVPAWQVLLAVAGAIVAGAGAFFAFRWALTGLSSAMAHVLERRLLTSAAAGAIAAFFVIPPGEQPPARPGFSAPVTASYARHVRLTWTTLAARGEEFVAPGPSLDSDLQAVTGADVLLIFIESYGAAAWERPDYASPLRADQAALATAVAETGRQVASAYVESPTFGGVSWLAHITLMTGIEVRDAERNAQVMAQSRDTLPTTFSRGGYRTVAVMPGLWQSWPEGVFYGFDDIYGGERLGYEGPPFGWWSIPDQFSLARLGELELTPSPRRSVFVFFPTVSTHAPFSPTPPYQRDWTRILMREPFDTVALDRAYEQWADWMNLGPGYTAAVSYTYKSLAGFLHERTGHDMVMILIGDHQPPAAVSGERAPWDVPVHVITGRPAVVNRLIEGGFKHGLTPQRPSLGPMHTLLPLLLEAFSSSAP